MDELPGLVIFPANFQRVCIEQRARFCRSFLNIDDVAIQLSLDERVPRIAIADDFRADCPSRSSSAGITQERSGFRGSRCQ